MTNLTKNLKKYYVRKLVDIFVIVSFIGALILLMALTTNSITLIIGLIVLFIGVHFLIKRLDNLLDKWIVPKMERKELETYHLTGSVTEIMILGTAVILAAVILALDTNTIWQMSGVAGVIILIMEIRKWRRFLKGEDELEEEGVERPTEEKEEKQIEKNIKKTQDAEIKRMEEKNAEEEAKKVVTESYVDMAKEDIATTIGSAKTVDNPDIKESKGGK